jgi:hypothetical protein
MRVRSAEASQTSSSAGEAVDRHSRRVSFQYRVIDTAGSEVGLIADERSEISENETVELPDGTKAHVVEVYDDEYGQEGGIVATLVVDVE